MVQRATHLANEDRISALDKSIRSHGWQGKVEGNLAGLTRVQQMLGATTLGGRELRGMRRVWECL